MLNEIAQPILYHASFDKIKKFWPLSHFGTYKAALSRIIDVLDDIVDDATPLPDIPVLLYPVRLTCENPLRTRDIYNERPFVVSEVSTYVLVKYKKHLNDDQVKQLKLLATKKTTPKSTQQLAQVLKTMGYDCLSYKNIVEDPGHHSMINLSSDQVQVLSEPMVIPAVKLHQLKKHTLGTWKEPQHEQMQPHQFVSSFDMTPKDDYSNVVVKINHNTLGI